MVGVWYLFTYQLAVPTRSIYCNNVNNIVYTYSNASRSRTTLTNESVRDSLSWNREILTMVAMVSIRMGGLILPWWMVDVTDLDEISVPFLR